MPDAPACSTISAPPADCAATRSPPSAPTRPGPSASSTTTSAAPAASFTRSISPRKTYRPFSRTWPRRGTLPSPRSVRPSARSCFSATPHVLERPLGVLENMHRARRSRRVPEVLSQKQVERLLASVSRALPPRSSPGCSTAAACASSEALRLRVKDLDFERFTVTVREGKGRKDRLTMLPRALVAPLKATGRLCARAPPRGSAYGHGWRLPAGRART